MNRNLNLVLALAAGLLGGLISRYISPVAVLAQTQTPVPREIRSQSFVLVNAQGVAMGLMGFDPQGRPVMKLVDERGRTIWSAGQTLVLPPSQ
jgi:hypothetical protein